MPIPRLFKAGEIPGPEWVRGDQIQQAYQPERIERPDILGQPALPQQANIPLSPTWTPDKFTSYYNLVKGPNAPEWATPDVVEIFDRTNQYLQDTGNLGIPVEIGNFLDGLPAIDVQPLTPEQTYAAPVVGARAPAGLPGQGSVVGAYIPQINNYWGLTPEQWAAMPASRKIAMSAANVQTQGPTTLGVGLTTAAVTRNPMMGLTALGLYSLTTRYPQFGKVLNYITEKARETFGVAGLIGEAALSDLGVPTGKETAKLSVGSLLQNLDKAAVTAEQAYRVNAFLSQAITPWEEGPLTVWGGPTAPLEEHQLNWEQVGGQALAEYYNRLVAGEDEDALDLEYQKRFGFEGDLADLMGLMFLDPSQRLIKGATNLTGKQIYKTGVKTGSKAKQVIGLAAESATGPINTLQLIKKFGKVLTREEFDAANAIEKTMLNTFTREPSKIAKTILGKKVEPGIRTDIAPRPTYNKLFAHIAPLFDRTAMTRAQGLGHVADETLPRVLEANGVANDVDGTLAEVQRMASADQATINAIGKATGIGGEIDVLVPMLRYAAPKLARYTAVLNKMKPMRDILNRVAKAAGRDVGSINRELNSLNGDEFARKYAPLVEGLTPEQLSGAAKTLKNGVLTDELAWAAQTSFLKNLNQKWIADHFGVAPKAWPYRISDLTRAMQGIVVLESPGYAFQNILNNQFMMIREAGLGSLFWTKGRTDKLMKKMYPSGQVPERFSENYMTDIQALEKIFENPIMEAAKGDPGFLTTAENFARKIGKFGFFRKFSQHMEGRMRYALSGKAVNDFMSSWKVDKSGKRGPKPIKDSVPDLSDDYARGIDDLIEDSYDIESIERQLLDKETIDFTPTMGIKRASEELGNIPGMSKQDIMQSISVKNPAGAKSILDMLEEQPITPKNARQVIENIKKQIAIDSNKFRKETFKARAEKAAAIADVDNGGSVLGMETLLDRITDLVDDTYMNRWARWDEVYAQRGLIPDDQFSELISSTRKANNAEYKAVGDEIGMLEKTVYDAIDTNSQYGAGIQKISGDIRNIFNDFFERTAKEKDAFWKKNKSEPNEFVEAEYANLETKHTLEYKEVVDQVELPMDQRDQLTYDLFKSFYGDEILPELTRWLTDRKTATNALYKFWIDFQENTLPNLTGADRQAAWANASLTAQAMSAGRKALTSKNMFELFQKGDLIERSGQKPPTPEVVQPETIEGETAIPRTPDKDPIGVLPPDGENSFLPNTQWEQWQEGLNTYIYPFLRKYGDVMADPANYSRPTLKGMNASQATIDAVLGHLHNEVAPKLNQTKHYATRYALQVGDNAMLNYGDRFGMDEVINGFMPYQFWYTRSGLNWLRTAIDNPNWIANWYRLRQFQDENSTELEGFPTRLEGKMRITGVNLPEGMGDTIYFDPLRQVFSFEAMASPYISATRRDFSNKARMAKSILYEMSENGEITEQEAENIAAMQTGPVWEQAYKLAEARVKSEINTPMDLISTISSPSLPIQWILSRKEVREALSKTKVGKFFALSEKPYGQAAGQMPLFATIQNATAAVGLGRGGSGINIVEELSKAFGGTGEGQRGFLWNYNVDRALSNMAGMGADTNEVMKAMVDKQGPLYEQAPRTVGQTSALRQLFSVFLADVFPEGEQKQRMLSEQFDQAAKEGKIGEFFDKNPAVKARLLSQKWDNPEEMMRYFLRSSIQDKWYNGMTKLEQKEAKEQLDAQSDNLFSEAFINKDTRDYDAISTETLVQWARQLNGVVPETAPAVPQAPALELPEADVSATYQKYLDWRKTQPGAALQNLMYGLPQGMQANFKMQHPEIVAYEEARNILISQNPELMPYLIGENSKYADAPIEVQLEIYDYLAEQATLYPLITLKNDYYWTLSKPEQKKYLLENPDLKEWFGWKEDRAEELSSPAFYYIKGEYGLDKLRGTEREVYYIDYDKFSPELSTALVQNTLLGIKLGTGANKALRQLWESEGKPYGSYERWFQEVLKAYSPQ